MDTWLAGQLPLIVWLQSLGGWLIWPMRTIGLLGSTPVLLPILMAVYWCFDTALGIRLGLLLLTSTGLNQVLKLFFGLPRPYWISPQVKALTVEPSFGLPSGHAQDSLVFWGWLAASFSRAWFRALTLAVVLLVALARLELGVHFPMDVLAGWLVGALLLGGFLAWGSQLAGWLGTQGDRAKILIALLASLSLLFAALLVWAWTVGRQVPVSWLYLASLSDPAGTFPDPRSLQPAAQVSGLFFGLAAGYVLLRRGRGFRTDGPNSQRLLRYLTGLAGLVILYFGPRLVLPAGTSLGALALTYLHHTIAGLWVSFWGPVVMLWLRLASPAEGSPGPPRV